MAGIICIPRAYKFDGIFFEYPKGIGGPWPLKKNGDLKKRAGRKFYQTIKKFELLSDFEKEKYKISGGCVRFFD